MSCFAVCICTECRSLRSTPTSCPGSSPSFCDKNRTMEGSQQKPNEDWFPHRKSSLCQNIEEEEEDEEIKDWPHTPGTALVVFQQEEQFCAIPPSAGFILPIVRHRPSPFKRRQRTSGRAIDISLHFHTALTAPGASASQSLIDWDVRSALLCAALRRSVCPQAGALLGIRTLINFPTRQSSPPPRARGPSSIKHWGVWCRLRAAYSRGAVASYMKRCCSKFYDNKTITVIGDVAGKKKKSNFVLVVWNVEMTLCSFGISDKVFCISSEKLLHVCVLVFLGCVCFASFCSHVAIVDVIMGILLIDNVLMCKCVKCIDQCLISTWGLKTSQGVWHLINQKKREKEIS